MKIRRKLEEIRVVLINSNFSEIRSSKFADDLSEELIGAAEQEKVRVRSVIDHIIPPNATR